MSGAPGGRNRASPIHRRRLVSWFGASAVSARPRLSRTTATRRSVRSIQTRVVCARMSPRAPPRDRERVQSSPRRCQKHLPRATRSAAAASPNSLVRSSVPSSDAVFGPTKLSNKLRVAAKFMHGSMPSNAGCASSSPYHTIAGNTKNNASHRHSARSRRLPWLQFFKQAEAGRHRV